MKKIPLQTIKRIAILAFKALVLQLFLVVIVLAEPRKIQPDKNIRVTITGKVSSEVGEPLPGVNIIEKGTNNGTVTDVDGYYSLELEEGAILIFSSIGYETKEIDVVNQTTINVTMTEDVQHLEELVVIGYGTRKKSDLTGSIFSIKEDELERGISSNISEKLKGVVPGVNIFQASGAPGAQARIRIRGNSSITGGNSPLYVIDGVPFTDSPLGGQTINVFGDSRKSGLNAINNADIQSIEVLKGPSAVAIYGSRGSNGVILITTKSGEAGANRVNYSIETGIKQPTRKLDVLNAQEYMMIRNDVADAYGDQPIFSQSDISTIEGTDWQDQIFRTGMYQNHNLSFSGGDKSVNYFTSFNYYDEDGIVISSGIKKYNARLNLQFNTSDKFNFGVRLNINRTDSDLVPTEGGDNVSAGVINAALDVSPTLSHEKEANGAYPVASNFLDNPLNIAHGYDAKRINYRTYGTAFAEYEIIPELTARFKLGADFQNDKLTSYAYRTTLNGAADNGRADVYNASRFNSLYEFTTGYQKDFGSSNINILGGVTYEHFTTEGNGTLIRGFPTDETAHYDLGLGDTERDEVSSRYEGHSLLSYIARLNYSFLSKYLFTATFRADGSSRFGENNKFGYFPSMAFAWRMSNEEFISQLNVFSDLKLRLSWGLTGNQEIGNYSSLATFQVSGTPVTFNNKVISTLQPSRLPNPNLKWEETEEFNIGLDLSFYDGRLSASFDYFVKTTHDLLFARPIPKNSGFATMLDNIGEIRNRGFEALVESQNITGDFSWKTSLNFAFIRNEVMDLGPVDQVIHGQIFQTSQIGIIREGEAMNSYFGHEILGIWQEGEEIGNSAQSFAEPGFFKYKDQNDDGQINAEDLVVMGNPDPDLTYGLMNSFSYKNFDLSLFIQGVQGVTLLNGNWIRSFYPIDYTRNRMSEPWLNRWTPSNPTNKYPSGIDFNSYGGSQVNNLTLQDASYIRLQNIQLSYNMPVENVRFIRSARISLMVNNAFILTDYNGYNPEAAKNTEMVVRAAANEYPLARTYSLGIRLGL